NAPLGSGSGQGATGFDAEKGSTNAALGSGSGRGPSGFGAQGQGSGNAPLGSGQGHEGSGFGAEQGSANAPLGSAPGHGNPGASFPGSSNGPAGPDHPNPVFGSISGDSSSGIASAPEGTNGRKGGIIAGPAGSVPSMTTPLGAGAPRAQGG